MHHSKLGPSTSERGREPPRHVNASAAAMPPAPDTKADARRGSSPERVAPLTDAAIAAAPNRISLKMELAAAALWRPQRVALSTSCARLNG